MPRNSHLSLPRKSTTCSWASSPPPKIGKIPSMPLTPNPQVWPILSFSSLYLTTPRGDPIWSFTNPEQNSPPTAYNPALPHLPSVTGIYIPITWASDQSPTELFLPHLTYPSPFISLSKLLFLKLARMAGDHANYSKNISQIIPIPKRYYPPYWESNVSWIHSLF